jgi:hypothetical protein
VEKLRKQIKWWLEIIIGKGKITHTYRVFCSIFNKLQESVLEAISSKKVPKTMG